MPHGHRCVPRHSRWLWRIGPASFTANLVSVVFGSAGPSGAADTVNLNHGMPGRGACAGRNPGSLWRLTADLGVELRERRVPGMLQHELPLVIAVRSRQR
jgi:hypothetical protein